jgi:SAM-dependent methyltransferase
VRLAVTTPSEPGPGAESAARAAALRHALPFAPRGGRSLAAVAAACGADGLLVLGAEARLWLAADAAGPGRRWSPGMGALRARRLAGGERATADGFLSAAQLRAGDAVLDCTLGLGADALVAAEAVGEGGRVVGLEASAALAAWVAEGLARLATAAARRVAVVRADHGVHLAACPERSFDVVVFDPMFRHARAQASGFDAVRLLADPRPLEAAAIARARRVARRAVIVKDGTPGWDLARLGLAPLPSARGAHRLYARLPPA